MQPNWKRNARCAATVAVVIGLVAATSAAGTTIKLATLVPDGSVWGKALREMGAEWASATEGRVSLRVYPGGVAGDDLDVVRKIRIGQLHAATLTVAGLAAIDPSFEALATPLVFDSNEEFFAVLKGVEPLLKERLEEKGFVLLHWGFAGWVRLFSKEPIRTIEDLRPQKVFVWAGDDKRLQLWKDNGFRPVPLAPTDLMTGLQTGLVEVYPSPPLAALLLQWFRQTPYMLDFEFAPLLGGTVVSKRIWNRLSEADRGVLLRAAAKVEKRLREEIPQQDRSSIEEMRQRGLEVTVASDESEWRRLADEFIRVARGPLVPEEALDRVLAEREAYRSRSVEGSP